MRLVVQRSLNSSVSVDGNITGCIDKGLVILVGFNVSDTEKDIDYLVSKVLNLRIFDDQDGKMNLNIKDVNGSILSISQFTLYSDTKKGNRPSFIESMKYDSAKVLYDLWNKKLESENIKVEKGVFGADMKVSILNDGPVTIILESR